MYTAIETLLIMSIHKSPNEKFVGYFTGYSVRGPEHYKKL